MKIVDKQVLSNYEGTRLTRFTLFAPLIAKNSRPGQFVVLMVTEYGERIPLTIVERNLDQKTIDIIFQEIGLTTKLLGKLEVGQSVYALLGPLGHKSEIDDFGRVVLVAGGVGIAEIYPQALALKKAGSHVTAVLGARTKDLLILSDELKQAVDDVYIVTDDGSLGDKGLVTDVLEKLIKDKVQINRVCTVGPIPMMSKVSNLTKEFKIQILPRALNVIIPEIRL